MPSVGFEPTILAGERQQTYALDRTANGIGRFRLKHNIKMNPPFKPPAPPPKKKTWFEDVDCHQILNLRSSGGFSWKRHKI